MTLTEPELSLQLILPAAVMQAGQNDQLIIEFQFPDAARPSDIGLGNDARLLAFGLKQLRVFKP
jgi:hypothetical protein